MTRFAWTSDRVRMALSLPKGEVPGREYSGVSTDSRTLRPGELFVALRGERFDATEFLRDAANAGALGAVVERLPEDVPAGFELFLVADALDALGQLAAARRRELDPTVVAITGTSGKTTTRELTAAVLGEGAYASPGNFNNLVGLPLSILAAPEEARIWVLEIASNSPGEVERLARVAEPDCAVITSVAEGHLEGLGDLRGVLNEKLGLLTYLQPGGCAFVADQPAQLARRARELCADVRTVGLDATADEHPDSWTVSEAGVEWTWRGVHFGLAFFGAHWVEDALFALSVARLLGVDPREMSERIGDVKLPPMRGEVLRIGDLLLLVDCYNANPSSFRAAIGSLTVLAGRRRLAVLAGTMLELGDRTAALHAGIAEALMAAGIELIAATGEFAAAFRRAATHPIDGLILEDELEDAYRELAARLRGDEAVLLKASRGMKFERVIPLFERDFGTASKSGVKHRKANEG